MSEKINAKIIQDGYGEEVQFYVTEADKKFINPVPEELEKYDIPEELVLLCKDFSKHTEIKGFYSLVKDKEMGECISVRCRIDRNNIETQQKLTLFIESELENLMVKHKIVFRESTDNGTECLVVLPHLVSAYEYQIVCDVCNAAKIKYRKK